MRYIVKRGDTLAAIAARLTGDESAYAQIAAYNSLDDPNRIVVGQVLEVPDDWLRLQAVNAASPAPVAVGTATASDAGFLPEPVAPSPAAPVGNAPAAAGPAQGFLGLSRTAWMWIGFGLVVGVVVWNLDKTAHRRGEE